MNGIYADADICRLDIVSFGSYNTSYLNILIRQVLNTAVRRTACSMKENAMKRSPRDYMDELDLVLIRELESDGRQTNTDLARKIGTSKATARRKLKKLLDDDIIKVVAVANPPALGYKTVATMGINVRPGDVDTVADKLASYDNVHFVIVSTGRYDIIAWMMFKEPEDLSDFLRTELGSIKGLVSVETMINLKIIKASFTYLAEESTS